MKRIFLPRLRTLWVILILITLAPAAVFSWRTRLVQRGEAERVSRDNILRVARMAADRHQRLMESTQQVLFLMTRLPALRTGDLEACNRLFADLLRQYPRYANIGMANLDGQIAAGGIPAGQTANVTDRPWFKRLSDGTELEPGDYHVDEISGKPVVVLSHPVMDNSGRLKFIAYAALDLDWINQVFAAAGLPAGSVMTISRADGNILARTLESEKWTGSPGPEAIALNSIAPESDATVESLGMDGVRRLYGFTQLHGRGNQASAYVSVGIPAAEAYAGADSALPRTLLILALTSVLAFTAVWLAGETFIGRSVRSLGAAMRSFRKGDMAARAGARTEAVELRELSTALDGMAHAIQSQLEEHRRSVSAARESEGQVKQALDAADRKIAGCMQSEESMQEEVRHLKEALRATAIEVARHGRDAEAQRAKECELRQCLDSSVTEVARLRVALQDMREELKNSQSSAETASAEAARFGRECQVLDQRVRLLEADLEIEVARSAECKRLELGAREDAQQARAALEESTVEINRRMQADTELKEGVRQIKIALETAAGEVTELQDDVELLRANERRLNEVLQAAETRASSYQRALESAISDLERQKRASSRSRAKDSQTERQALAQKLDEDVADFLAGIKSGLESMHKMAGKSPLGMRLQESINSLENARQKVRDLAKGLVPTGGV